MPIIISIVIFLILTMQTFFLGGTVWLGIVGMLLSAAGVVLSFVLKNRKKYLSNVSALAGIVISVVLFIYYIRLRHGYATAKRDTSRANGQCKNSGERRRKIC